MLASMLDHMLEMMSRGLPYEEKKEGRVATVMPLAATVALTEILKVAEVGFIFGWRCLCNEKLQ